MRKSRFLIQWFIVILMGLSFQACSSATPPVTATPTLIPTITLSPSPTATATLTSTPTRTPSPTNTPNLTATQQYGDFQVVVQKLYDSGVISTLQGSYQMMGDYSDQSADAGRYRWNLYDNEIGSFIVRAQIKLETAPAPASQSGCGFVFGVSDNSQEFVFLQRNGTAIYGINGRAFTTKYYDKLQNPAEFTMVVVALEKEVHVLINDKPVIKIPLDLKRNEIKEVWGPALLSGSTQEFGTKCDFKNIELWEIANS